MKFQLLLDLYQDILKQGKQYINNAKPDESFLRGYQIGVYDLFQGIKLFCKKTYTLDSSPKNKEKYILADTEFLCLLKYRDLTLPVYIDHEDSRYFCNYRNQEVFGFADLNPWDWITAQLDCIIDDIQVKVGED